MRCIRDPRHRRLIDLVEQAIAPNVLDELHDSWQGLFRESLLELMPVEELAGKFHPTAGRPTMELYSMAGLIFLKEFNDWTVEEAAMAYRCHTDIQYALNLETTRQEISTRTVERYVRDMVEMNLAGEVMQDVTARLIDLLGIKVDRQRLDSTHVFSDMANFGRTRMMGVTVRNFLTQLKRHDPASYESLPEDFRERYVPSRHRLFGDVEKTETARRALRQQVAEDMLFLIRRFENDSKHNERSTFKMLDRVFGEQCEIVEDAIVVKEKPGGGIVQNPSDPDAGRDQKGAGYQAQIAETCAPENDVQLITHVEVESAAESDSNAAMPVVEALIERGLKPESLQADAAYGGDSNVEACAALGVELVSPTSSGVSKIQAMNMPGSGASLAGYDDLTLDDFAIDEETELVERCPAGHVPERSEYNPVSKTTTTTMGLSACSRCEYAGECPVRRTRGRCVLTHTAKARRLESRRREELTDAFRERYKKRSGIESTNSGLKRRTGMGRLRVRGLPRVSHSVQLKAAGWNLLQGARCLKNRKIAKKRAEMARKRRVAKIRPRKTARNRRIPLRRPFWSASNRQFGKAAGFGR